MCALRASATQATTSAPFKFVDAITDANVEAIPIDDTVRKYFEPCDINPGKNAIQFGNFIRVIINADTVNADIEPLEV